MRKRRPRQPLPQRRRGRPAPLPHLLHHGRIVPGIGDHRHEPMVLRRRPDQRRPPDIDILDAVLPPGARVHRRRKRIEVHHDEIDPPDPMLLHRLAMLGQIPPRQNPPMDLRMQRLNPPIHHLRESRVRRHLHHRHPRVPQRLSRSPRRKYLDALRRQKPPKLDKPRLVRNRNQRPLDRVIAHEAGSSPTFPRPLWAGGRGRGLAPAGATQIPPNPLTECPPARQRSAWATRRYLTCSLFVHTLLSSTAARELSRLRGDCAVAVEFLPSCIRPLQTARPTPPEPARPPGTPR